MFACLKRSLSSSAVHLVDYGKYLTDCLPRFVDRVTISRGSELNLHLKGDPHESLLPTMQFLRDHNRCQFSQLMDMTAVDWPKDVATLGRFELVYCLLSMTFNSRLTVHCRTASSTSPSAPSVAHLYPSANWAERECFDMFGISFEGHPDLRRILTDYGFEGHPLRKDFPLTGFVEVRYDEELKRVIEEPLEMTQEFRRYEYSMPVRTLTLSVPIVIFSGSKCQSSPRPRSSAFQMRPNKHDLFTFSTNPCWRDNVRLRRWTGRPHRFFPVQAARRRV